MNWRSRPLITLSSRSLRRSPLSVTFTVSVSVLLMPSNAILNVAGNIYSWKERTILSEKKNKQQTRFALEILRDQSVSYINVHTVNFYMRLPLPNTHIHTHYVLFDFFIIIIVIYLHSMQKWTVKYAMCRTERLTVLALTTARRYRVVTIKTQLGL